MRGPDLATRHGPGPSPGRDRGPSRDEGDRPGRYGERLRALARERFDRTARVSDAFFREEADAISRACRDMAARFHRGGRLLAFGRGAAETDAWHVSVEFVHPVLVGKRALPALCLEGEPAAALDRLARSEDIALGITVRDEDPPVREALARAAGKGLLTVGLAGGEADALAGAGLHHRFAIPSADATVVQEVQETLYHVLWELVHVFFDHPALLEAGEEGGG